MLGFMFTAAGATIFALIAIVIVGMFLLSRVPKRLTIVERDQLRVELGARRLRNVWKK